jgi:phosphatidylserine/phosphatidylglycerophosphate/cardiolipin synthase-like enzyme
MRTNLGAWLLGGLAVWLAGCGGAIDKAPVAQVVESAEEWISVAFTEPLSPLAGDYRGGPDEALAEAIDGARVSVDAAIYDLNLWSVRNALIDAHRRGVQVRIVVESDNLRERAEMQELAAAGIPLAEDSDPDTMHNKFVVIDRYEVWTGSMNFTTSGAYRNWNNLLRLRSTHLAADYTAEFEEMFVLGLFGEESIANTPDPRLEINGLLVEVFFAPEDGAQARLVELVNAAEESVYFLAFSLTADPLADALIAAQARGVEVLGVMEGSQVASNTGGDFAYLLENGVGVREDGQTGQMHHKVIIIDRRIVVTGSYNFSRNAEERNDENLLVITDMGLAADYEAEFWQLWALTE